MDKINEFFEKVNLPGWTKTFFYHNRWTALAGVLSVIISVNLIGCQPQTNSPYSKKKVTAAQLDAEGEAYQVSADSRMRAIMAEVDEKKTLSKAAYADLQHQRDIIKGGLDIISGLTGMIPAPFQQTGTSILALMSAALLADNSRKNTKIQELQAANPTMPDPDPNVVT